ncbi:transposase [Rickettsia endosymbiont of Ixodes scapularis]|uniref:transposase n=1 Tax=Rickettsia endosymbiont of Ixodes scapularis TaxID=444612 RepID=UPI0035282C46
MRNSCYIKQELFDELYVREIKLVTGIKKNMKNKLIPLIEKILLRKRSIIETVFSVLKRFLNLNIQDIDQFGMPSSISYLLLLLTV